LYRKKNSDREIDNIVGEAYINAVIMLRQSSMVILGSMFHPSEEDAPPVSSSNEEDVHGSKEEDAHGSDEEYVHGSEKDARGREEDHWHVNEDESSQQHSDS
jgi:hypothetical protein